MYVKLCLHCEHKISGVLNVVAVMMPGCSEIFTMIGGCDGKVIEDGGSGDHFG